jgi:hypothetical protein
MAIDIFGPSVGIFGTDIVNVTNYWGIRIRQPGNATAGVITNRVALRIDSHDTIVGVTNLWGIQVAGVDQKSYHEPPLMIGAAIAPTALLHVQHPTLGSEVQRLESVATNDDPGERVFQNRVTTTNATVTTIHTVAIPTDTVVFIEAKIVGRRTGGTAAVGATGDGYAAVVRQVYRNVAGVVTEGTVAVGAELDFESQHDAAWGSADSAVSGTNAIIRVTGKADMNVTWHTTVRIWQVAS